MGEKRCNVCDKQTRERRLKRIRREWYCSSCASKIRKRHREETIKESGIGEELEELKKKEKGEWAKRNREKVREYNRGVYLKKNPNAVRYRKFPEEAMPKIKGRRSTTRKKKSNAYLLLDEKRLLFGHLVRRGYDEQQARERIKNLTESLRELRIAGKKDKEMLEKKADLMQGLLSCCN